MFCGFVLCYVIRGKDAGSAVMENNKSEEEFRWRTLTPSQKLKDWTIRNQYSVLAGGWALSMAVAGAIIARDKCVFTFHIPFHECWCMVRGVLMCVCVLCCVRRHQTATQKIVQVRMWAQGLTVGLLIGAGILTQSQRKEAAAHRPVDHSWKDIVRLLALPCHLPFNRVLICVGCEIARGTGQGRGELEGCEDAACGAETIDPQLASAVSLF